MCQSLEFEKHAVAVHQVARLIVWTAVAIKTWFLKLYLISLLHHHPQFTVY